MAKKKKNKSRQQQDRTEFQANPFSALKGFAVSAADPSDEPVPQREQGEESGQPDDEELFAREMSTLGVKQVDGKRSSEESDGPSRCKISVADETADEKEFLEALGELTVRFETQPEGEDTRQASPRRMKLLKQGRLKPEATLDLHGLLRHQVAEKVRFFLQDAQFRGHQTLLIVTGRGLHSQHGEPVLRVEAERFLQGEGRAFVAEWARAPRQYGGQGALIVFLKG